MRAVKRDRLEALYVVCLSLGLRRGEVLGLTWDDVDLDKGLIHIRHTRYLVRGRTVVEEPKTKASKRQQLLAEVARASLKAHRIRQQQERLRLGERWHSQNYVFTNFQATKPPSLDGPFFADFVVIWRAHSRPFRAAFVLATGPFACKTVFASVYSMSVNPF